MPPEFVLRDRTPEDTSFLYASYLKSFHRGHPVKFIPNSLYFQPQTELLDFLLDSAHVLLACFPEAPEEIVGWVLYQHLPEALVVHYVYVKAMHRGNRIGKLMLDSILNGKSLVIATHASDEYVKLKHKLPQRLVYDPHLLQTLRKLAS